MTSQSISIACIYCRCTDDNACVLSDSTCSWYEEDPRVCSNPECLAKYQAGVPPFVEQHLGEYDTNPPIAEREEAASTLGDLLASDVGKLVVLALDTIAPDPAQARDEGADDDLASSIAAQGVLQPIIVYAHLGDEFGKLWMIEDGERRYRGAIKAGLRDIPARVIDAPSDEGDKLLHQNLFNDGKRLKPMEEARSWKRIMASKQWTIAQLAKALGRPKSTVSDRLAILEAPAAFRPLFETGTLTAAAAPILRAYAELPDKVLEDLVKDLTEHEWEDEIAEGKPIALDQVKRGLQSSIDVGDVLRPIDKRMAEMYTGPVVTIKGEAYATDVKAYEAITTKQTSKPSPSTHVAAPERNPYAEQQRKAQKAAKAKAAVRRAQFAAVSAKLPSSLDAKWSLFLVQNLMKEMHHDALRAACTSLGVETKKKGGAYGGWDFAGSLGKHAESLSADARVQMALQLLLAPDLTVSPNYDGGAKRLAAAAELLKLDLAKIKPPIDEKAKLALQTRLEKKPAKKSPKKARR